VLFHDVTALRRAAADRERLPSRLIRMQEDDRRELATRLHKDVVRGLAAALRQFDGVQERLPATEEQTRQSVHRVVDMLNHSLQVTRSLLSDLRPPLLETQAWSRPSTSSSARSLWRPGCTPSSAGGGRAL